MRASAFEFRLRVVIMVAVIAFGAWSPWIEMWGIGGRISLLEWVSLETSRLGLLSFRAATPAVIVLSCVIALLAAVLRVWGTAWLGSGVVNNLEMQAGGVVAAGPFRYVRNPLYLGTWLMIAAISFTLPATGAAVTLALLSVFLLRLILGEEAFLASKLGEPYQLYRRAVPRLFPRLRSNVPAATGTPNWGRAVLAETNAIGIALILAVFSWRYDNDLMVRAIVVNFGVSLVLRAIVVKDGAQASATA